MLCDMWKYGTAVWTWTTTNPYAAYSIATISASILSSGSPSYPQAHSFSHFTLHSIQSASVQNTLHVSFIPLKPRGNLHHGHITIKHKSSEIWIMQFSIFRGTDRLLLFTVLRELRYPHHHTFLHPIHYLQILSLLPLHHLPPLPI
jgi:hypothetical protein